MCLKLILVWLVASVFFSHERKLPDSKLSLKTARLATSPKFRAILACWGLPVNGNNEKNKTLIRVLRTVPVIKKDNSNNNNSSNCHSHTNNSNGRTVVIAIDSTTIMIMIIMKMVKAIIL